MKQRCYSTTSQSAKYYRDKGIIICDEWRQDFKRFKQWALGHGYADNLTIDRIDPDGNYEPKNCRWITREENSRRARRKESHLNNDYMLSTLDKKKRAVIAAINEAFPRMSAERRGYLLGYTEAMADKADDEKKAAREKEEQPA